MVQLGRAPETCRRFNRPSPNSFMYFSLSYQLSSGACHTDRSVFSPQSIRKASFWRLKAFDYAQLLNLTATVLLEVCES